jgi:precorrin-4/cobalt-precorrin-4 C11-methyltransferase
VFAASGATLVIHLAIQSMDRIVEELTPHYGESCPVAVIMRASWPDQRIVRATLGEVSAALAREPMERTALVLVGPVLAAEGFEESALYSPDYHRRFRDGRAS